MYACASPVGAGDAGGAGGAKGGGGVLGGIFERVKSPNFFCGKIIESIEKIFGTKKDLRILKSKSKIHLNFRVLHSIIPLGKGGLAVFINKESNKS